ncbi:hypothetical protein K491DRAFT_702587 [Lophiostoma macrostomum CBS 122681]|uniref:Magnesium chelatase n=1 Tax=Lophiostoma macrostomum CBS 122681 TaxID=1314788 RepID=A0A6A6TIB5_9PLEO|nr:hypothetical protein K491DRAFT_702587 [Lophiostoma macrostomum CBS 122681]
MENSGERIAEKVQALSDIELAVLLCLVADQHCIIETEGQLLDNLQHELEIVATSVFGLTCSVLECSQQTTLDDFGSGILVTGDDDDYFGHSNEATRSDTTKHSDRRKSRSSQPFSPLDSKRIANVVIAKNLNDASSEVQVQALELIRGKRNFTRTAVHAAPRPFLFIALNVSGTARLTTHLNDQIFISHKHQPEDGFANLEDLQGKEPIIDDDDASTASVVRSSSYKWEDRKGPQIMFSQDEINQLTKLTSEVRISSDVRAYLHNIVVFMRLHRAVGGGISAMATRHFDALSHALAPLHGLTYISPSLVALAARKIYPHRIVITVPERERSMQWGSSLEAVKAVLEGVTVEDVIEEVLQSVEVPL